MYTVGIDPGLTETGMVLLAPEGHYLSGITFTAPKDGQQDLQRIVNLADTVVSTIKSWVFDHKISGMLVAIEYPILRGGDAHYNVEAYRKQVNLLHEIEAGLWRWQNETNFRPTTEMLGGLYDPKIRIAEINPTASKRVATGSGAAGKDEMVAASPFARRERDMRRPTREALADAWAHAVTARLAAGVGRLIELEELARERLAPKWVETHVFKVEVRS